MRILFLDQFATLGGGQRILVDVAEGFAAEGHSVLVGIPPADKEPGEVASELDKRGIEHVDLNLARLTAGSKGIRDILHLAASTIVLRRQLKSLVAERGIDLIYVNGPRCLPAAVLVGKPVVAAIHLVHEGKEKRLLEWCFARPNVRLVTFCSKFAAAPFQTGKGLVVPNWVSPAIVDAPNRRAEMRQELGLEPHQVAVGVLGRISPNKGQAFLIEALEPILGPDLRLYIAGAADHEAPTALPKSPFVHELGKVDPAPFLDAMDILVVPTLVEEAFGLTAAEAMSRGLPVVATKNGGLTEVVISSETGYLVDSERSALASAISKLAAAPEVRRNMGEAGKERVLHNYVVSSSLLSLMERVTGSVQSGRPMDALQ